MNRSQTHCNESHLAGSGAKLEAGRSRPVWWGHLADVLPLASLALYGAGALLSLHLMLGHRELTLFVPGVLQHGLSFKLDSLSCLFILVASTAWFFAGLFSLPYLKRSHATGSQAHGNAAVTPTASPHSSSHVLFYTAFLLSFLFTAAVFASGDYLTLFLFFELLTLSSYLLVRYEGTPEAEKAGTLYLYMSLAGGLLVLGGILLVSWYSGSFAFSNLHSLPERAKLVAVVLLSAGFGVKAGLPGLNVWLPEAHPVAPSPASAVLSGVMIKVGAYGIMLTFSALGESPWRSEAFLAIAFLGVFDIWWGGLRALREDNLKRILAFSSVSQMGYILVAIGSAGAFGNSAHAGAVSAAGALGTSVEEAWKTGSAGLGTALSGALYHIIGHSLFKACLFLVAGAALLSRGSTSLRDLSGVARSSPWVSLGTVTAALAITGFPGLTGFASKTLIHEALLEAVHGSPAGVSAAVILEKGFLWGSYLTAVYFGRVLIHLYGLNKKPGEPAKVHRYPIPAIFAVVFGGYFVLLLLTGISPGHVLNLVVSPAASALGSSSHEEIPVHFFSPETLAPVAAGYVIAGGILLAGRQVRGISAHIQGGTLLEFYRSTLPRMGTRLACWFSRLNALATQVYCFFAAAAWQVVRCFGGLEKLTQTTWAGSSHAALAFVQLAYRGDSLDARAFSQLKHAFFQASFAVGQLEAGEDRLVSSAQRLSGRLIRWIARKETSFEESVERGARSTRYVPLAAGKIDGALSSEAQTAARGAGSLVQSASKLVEASRPRAVQDWLDQTTADVVVRASRVLIWLTLGIVAFAAGALLIVR
ncbi:MAG: NADH dehydrogenase [Firmicutes bacterium]|nr:NADH dehydrogenase [Candidatus Fermentithermobacillaceae bacterium]